MVFGCILPANFSHMYSERFSKMVLSVTLGGHSQQAVAFDWITKKPINSQDTLEM